MPRTTVPLNSWQLRPLYSLLMCCTGFCPLSTLPGSSKVCQPLLLASGAHQPLFSLPKHTARGTEMCSWVEVTLLVVWKLTAVLFVAEKEKLLFLWESKDEKLAPLYCVHNLIFQQICQSSTKVESLHRVKAIWSVAPISIPAYLKVLIVKLIWIWNFLRRWTRMPSLPMNIHLTKPYWWFWVSLLPGHVWRLRCVLNFLCPDTGILLTPLTLHVG